MKVKTIFATILFLLMAFLPVHHVHHVDRNEANGWVRMGPGMVFREIPGDADD